MARPKRVFTDEQIKQMQDYALVGCQNNTIATLMDIPLNTLLDRFRKILTKKRAERKFNLRTAQSKALEAGNPALLIFLGKNELEQTDKRELTHMGNIAVSVVNYGSKGAKDV